MIDRREALWLGLAALAASACGVRRTVPDLPLPERRHLADARLVGEEWLGTASPRPSAADLADELADGAPESALADAGGFARHLRRRHAADLVAGRTERVRGWLLSRTEAVLYGLLATLPD